MLIIPPVSSQAATLGASVAVQADRSLQAFAKPEISEDQRAQIRAILQAAKRQNLSGDTVRDRINAVLRPPV